MRYAIYATLWWNKNAMHMKSAIENTEDETRNTKASTTSFESHPSNNYALNIFTSINNRTKKDIENKMRNKKMCRSQISTFQ